MKKPAQMVFSAFILIGLGTFILGLWGNHPERVWQSYVINFLFWSGMAQGALVFSALMHITKARWSGPLSGLSEAFAAFFPVSFILFFILFIGRTYIFPWMHEDLHGKEVWLNIPFLFSRDLAGLLILYLFGFVYLYYALQLKFDPRHFRGGLRKFIPSGWQKNGRKVEFIKGRMSVWGGLYILAFAFVLSLIGYDLIMSMEPDWISSLFGAYIFIKAIYAGLGGLIILASVHYLKNGEASGITGSHFHDSGKLLFAFCLLWADFFYAQFLVIWYGNISEETHFVILRTMVQPWKTLAWTVFFMDFIIPFVVLLNRKIKTKPVLMILLCSMVLIGIWLEHLLLLSPSWNRHATALPLGLSDIMISLGFLGALVLSISLFMRSFPEVTISVGAGPGPAPTGFSPSPE
jgi:Ni/Fe-hydrogenase subunit HybB-like protein